MATPESINSDGELEEISLVDHLVELRKRVIYIVAGVALGAIVSWFYKEAIFDLIRSPISPYLKDSNGGLIYTSPMENFMAYIKMSALSGLIISCPFWLYHLWKFIAPALYKDEKKYAVGFITLGSCLFAGGVSFVYFVVYPIAFEFLLSFGRGQDQALIKVSEYLSFFLNTTLLFGLAFEMPLILSILGVMGVIDRKFLVKNRRYAIMVLALTSAVMTPPDPASMLLMMLPMLLLYELSIILVGLLGEKKT